MVRHPGNGRQSLFVNRGFTTRINELDRKESDALLEFLWAHVEQHVEFQCRVRWEPNTLVFWDNRATQHHAVWDYYPFSRYGERVSIVGSRPVAKLGAANLKLVSSRTRGAAFVCLAEADHFAGGQHVAGHRRGQRVVAQGGPAGMVWSSANTWKW